MKRVIISSIISTLFVSSLNAGDVDNKIFGSFEVGFSHLNNDKEDKLGSINLIENQNKRSENFKLALGYEYSRNIDFSVNYQKVFNDDVDLDNIFLQSRYKFTQKIFTPYVGAMLGYSKLSWNKLPILTVNNDLKSGSYIVGLNTGLLYPLTKSSELIIDYSLAYMGHKTDLQTTSSNIAEIRHDYLNSISIGIKVNF